MSELGISAGLLEQLMTLVVASLLLICMIKICLQIAPERVRMARSAAQGPDRPQLGPLAELPQAMLEASLALGQCDGFVPVLLPQAEGLSSAWHGQGTRCGAIRGQF